MAEERKHEHIHVRVSFPISKDGPYEAEDGPDATVGIVLEAAMKHFKVENDSQFSYVLSYDGEEQADSTTIGSLAGEHNNVRFTLVKKITQG